MPRDKNTRPCIDCGQQQKSWEWCDVCQSYVCDDCNDGHDCSGITLGARSETDAESDDAPDAQHELDCDDPDCQGCSLGDDSEEEDE